MRAIIHERRNRDTERITLPERAQKAIEAAAKALDDLLLDRSAGEKIDTKVLKDVTAALKDLNTIAAPAEEAADRSITVRFSSEALDASE